MPKQNENTRDKTMGDKPALVFVPGFRGDRTGFNDLVAQFPDYEVFTPNLPPFGDAPGLSEYTAKSYADYLIGFIHKNKLKKPILIGHSMGSVVVAATAKFYPEELNKKVIFLAPISVKPAKFFAILQPLVAILPNFLVSFITTVYLVAVNDYGTFKKILKKTYVAANNFTSRRDIGKSGRFSVKNSVGDFKIDKEILMLGGERDHLISKRKTEEVGKKIGATVHFVEGAGHLLNYEKPKEAAEIIRQFIR